MLSLLRGRRYRPFCLPSASVRACASRPLDAPNRPPLRLETDRNIPPPVQNIESISKMHALPALQQRCLPAGTRKKARPNALNSCCTVTGDHMLSGVNRATMTNEHGWNATNGSGQSSGAANHELITVINSSWMFEVHLPFTKAQKNQVHRPSCSRAEHRP